MSETIQLTPGHVAAYKELLTNPKKNGFLPPARASILRIKMYKSIVINNKSDMSFITRQKNGLLCRFSTVIDTVTDYNMTDEEYIEMCAQKAREKAQETLKHSLRPFEEVKASFAPTNMSRSEFNRILRLMEKEIKS